MTCVKFGLEPALCTEINGSQFLHGDGFVGDNAAIRQLRKEMSGRGAL